MKKTLVFTLLGLLAVLACGVPVLLLDSNHTLDHRSVGKFLPDTGISSQADGLIGMLLSFVQFADTQGQLAQIGAD